MEKKICKKCGEEKLLNEFTYNKTKSWIDTTCKVCKNNSIKEYRENNKDKQKIYEEVNKIKLNNNKIEWAKNNKEKVAKTQKKYYDNNKEKIKENGKIYREEHKDELNEYNREYSKNNREYFKLKKKEYTSSEKGKETKRNWCNKYNNENKHIVAWISMLRRVILQLQQNKNDSTLNVLGYSAEELKKHIENNFLTGMSWDNYGE